MEIATSTPPVAISVTVDASPQRAFEVFTDRFHSWWPTSHHTGEHPPTDIVIESHAGGRWYERGPDGTECDWGTVLVWEPPHRLVLAWQLNGDWEYEPDLDRASEVEVRFVEQQPGRTRVDFTHGMLDRHGASAASIRSSVAADRGWPTILRSFAAAVDQPA